MPSAWRCPLLCAPTGSRCWPKPKEDSRTLRWTRNGVQIRALAVSVWDCKGPCLGPHGRGLPIYRPTPDTLLPSCTFERCTHVRMCMLQSLATSRGETCCESGWQPRGKQSLKPGSIMCPHRVSEVQRPSAETGSIGLEVHSSDRHLAAGSLHGSSSSLPHPGLAR